MAANDPTTSVPTPTGALQGVAASSWDGSVWQPAGRTGPSVATPTGVLQGVAPFSWDGTAWQPSGRSGPGVATPTGVLDGVAVYTWSGSAWLPAGGQPTSSTPTGALRGIAAFSWDGAAWQPAGRAGPSVATSTGVLLGVAMFNWTGSAWTAGSALPAGATLDLSFLTPGTLDPRITFTRASTATYFDAAGVMQTATTNVPRWDYDPVTHALRGMLIEEARTNLLLNSAALGTQSVAVAAQAYTLSFYGTGTITLSGASTGSLVGTGAANRVLLAFTPTAGTLTCTVTGSVTTAQLEAGAFSTSYIPTTAAAATRAIDVCWIPTAAWFSPTAFSLQVETFGPFHTAGSAFAGVSDATFGNTFYIGDDANPNVAVNYTPAGGGSVADGLISRTAVNKICAVFSTTRLAIVANALTVGSAVIASTPIPAATRLVLGNDPWSMTTAMNGHMRRARFWPRALSNAEMQAVTT